MRLTVTGSGGCMPIPRPCCACRVCRQARQKGPPYARTGPSLFVHDIGLLVDTPAEIGLQLNRAGIPSVARLLFTHLDPDHVEGLRVVEQIALDFRTWEGFAEREIELLLPRELHARFQRIHSAHGPLLAYYEQQKLLRSRIFSRFVRIKDFSITAIPVDREDPVFIYVFERNGRKVVYAPCDIKPFPEEHPEVRGADLLLIQPGIFETGLREGFVYPADHVSRTTLYTFEQTLALAARIKSERVVLVHLEEYWNRSFDDYLKLEKEYPHIRFACDGLELTLE